MAPEPPGFPLATFIKPPAAFCQALAIVFAHRHRAGTHPCVLCRLRAYAPKNFTYAATLCKAASAVLPGYLTKAPASFCI